MDARTATILVVAAMAILFGWQMFAVRQTALHEAGHQAMALARTAELQVLGGVRNADLLTAEIESLLIAHPIDDHDLQPTLRTRLATYPDLRSLTLMDNAGHVVQTITRTQERTLGTLPPPPVVVIRRSLRGVDGSSFGSVAIGLVAQSFVAGLAALPLAPDDRVWLVGPDHTLVVGIPPDSEAPPLPFPTAVSVFRLTDTAAQTLAGHRDHLVAMRPVEGLPLAVAVGLSVSTILGSWRDNLLWYGSTMLALAALVLVYAWLLDRQSRSIATARREKDRVRAAAAAHQRRVLDATIDGLLTIHADGSILGLNRSAERIFGYPGETLLGHPVTLVIPTLVPNSQPAARGGEAMCWHSLQGEVMGLHRDGRAVPVDVVITELPAVEDLAEGAPVMERVFIGTVRDLSERRAAEAALRASQARNAAILAAAADGIIAVDSRGRMETVNAAACRIFGYEPAQMIGENIAALMPTPLHASHDHHLAECVRNGQLHTLDGKREVTALRRDGSEFPLDIAVSCMEQAEGPLFIAVLADITQRKEAELALRSAKLDAEAANQAKTQFLAHMSHELRTPLNAIIGFSDMMKHEMMGSLSAVYLDYARNINDSGRQLIGIIDDLLDVSRLQLGKFTLNDGVVDLHSAVAGALAMMRSRADENGIVLTEGVAESLPKLRGDARAIRQVLINLVSNAVKFTPRGGTVRVSAEESTDDGRLLLAVADTGRGIPPDLIDRVLDPFHHADAFKANKTRGIGLGLPICRWLMELHGGSITIESTTTIGTTIIASFPKDRVLQGIG